MHRHVTAAAIATLCGLIYSIPTASAADPVKTARPISVRVATLDVCAVDRSIPELLELDRLIKALAKCSDSAKLYWDLSRNLSTEAESQKSFWAYYREFNTAVAQKELAHREIMQRAESILQVDLVLDTTALHYGAQNISPVDVTAAVVENIQQNPLKKRSDLQSVIKSCNETLSECEQKYPPPTPK